MAGNARRDSDKRSNRSLTEEVRSLRSKVAKLERLNARHEDFSQVYRALVEHSAEGLAIIQDGRVVFANTMMVRITGYSVAELTAMSADQVQAFVHPEDREEVWRRHGDRLAGELLDGPFQFRGLNKNGEVRWYEVRACRIIYQGRAAVQAAYSDITGRVEAEQTLRESERK